MIPKPVNKNERSKQDTSIQPIFPPPREIQKGIDGPGIRYAEIQEIITSVHVF